MKQLYKTLLVLAGAAAAAACGKTGTAEEPSTIHVRSFLGTRADNEVPVDRNLQPLFLFWTDGADFSTDTPAEPNSGDGDYYFICEPDNVVDDFKEFSYNTRIPYPGDNAPVHANGFAPAPKRDGETALLPTFTTEGKYDRFTIPGNTAAYPDDSYGVLDVLAAQATVSGTNKAHIGTPLQFIHAQTKLSFRGRLADSMTKFIKFVRVQFPGSLTPMALEWNDAAQVYEVKGGTDGTDDFVFGNFWTTNGESLSLDSRANGTMSFQLSSDKAQSMGYTYIVPPCSDHITVKVLYEMAEGMNDFGSSIGTGTAKEMEVEVDLNFVDADGNPIELKAGDAYSFTLYFDTYNIELTGRQRAWEDGGYVSLPIQIR